MRPLLLAVVLVLTATASSGCRNSTRANRAPDRPTVSVPRGGGDEKSSSFQSVLDLARHYKSEIVVPIGVPLGAAQSEEVVAGTLDTYSYVLLGGIGDVFLFRSAPPAGSDLDARLDHPKDFVEVRRATVQVHGNEALLIQERPVKYGYLDRFRLLWVDGGRLVQAAVASAGFRGSNPTVGPDALISIANATKAVPVSDVDAAGILVEPAASGDPFRGDVTTFTLSSEAARVFGAPVQVPADFSYIHVVHAGALRSYTVDLDAQGAQRLFIMPGTLPTSDDAKDPGVTEFRTTTVGGRPGVYEKIQTSAGVTSLLFFEAKGTQFMLRDSGGGSAGDLAAVAGTVGNAAQQAPSISVGSPTLASGKVQIPVTTAGSGFAPYNGFSVHLRWSSAVFSYSSANSTGGVLASPLCPSAVADSDGGGVTYACVATGGATSTAGLLATIVLTPAASGCSPLHLFTFGAPDGGVASNGTYTVDADTNAPQSVAYVDGSANVSGQVC